MLWYAYQEDANWAVCVKRPNKKLINFNLIIAHIGYETIRFVVLYMDFYIPYVFVIYMLFGGPSDLFGITKSDIHAEKRKLVNFFDVVS